MGLQIWLPLDGNLTNLGLNPVTFKAVGTGSSIAASTTNGKVVSGAYIRNTANTANHIISNENILLDKDFSMCCWAKVTGIGSAATANGIITQHGHLSGGSGITMKDVSSTDLRMSINTGINSDTRTYCTYYGTTNIYNAWHHLCVTYNRATQQYRMYVDGKKETIVGYGDYIIYGDTAIPRPFCLFAWSTDHVSSPDYRPPCALNDVRVYDHCLSPKEVHEIAKGLVAHYQLKGMGRTNYMKGSGKYTRDNPLIRNATDSSVLNDSYIYYDLSDLSITVPTNGTYTLVLEADNVLPSSHTTGSSSASERRLGIFLQNTSTGNHYFWSNYGTGSTGQVYGSFDLPAGTYKFRTNLYANDRVNYRVKIWNMKIVQGGYDPNDIWCPHADDELYNFLRVDNSICTDASGYGNTLTKVGSISLVGGSPRYGSCIDFNQTGYLKKTDFNMTTNEFTIAFWLNPPYSINAQHFICGTFSSWTGNGFGMWRDSTGGGYSLLYKSNSEGGHTGFPAITPTHDTWSHIAIVYTGTQGIAYLNGAEVARVEGGSSGTVSHPVLYLGNSMFSEVASQTDEASMSDFRFYTTALSASDIVDLYKNGASIAKDGTLFTYDFHENKRNTIDKNGIIASSSFNTKVIPTADMKIKTLEDGSIWARIHHLDLTNDKTFFANASEVAECSKHNRFSRMGDVDKFKSQPSLPGGYTELEYIESSGTQYIDTGIVYSNTKNFRTKMRFSYTTVAPENQIHGFTGNRGMGIGTSGATWWECSTPSSVSVGTLYEIDWRLYNNGDYDRIINGNHNTGGGGGGQSDYTGNMYLFAAHLSAGTTGFVPSYMCQSKLYYTQIYENDILVRNFVPCKNPSGTVGLYDLVEKKFYGNSGSGSFTAGTFVSKYEFMLTYPSLSSTEYNRWTQTSSPNATSVTGYTPINIAWPAHSAGIRKHGSACIYNCDSGDTWYAPIGQTQIWEGGIPAANGTMQLQTELWVRTDKSADATQTKIYDGTIVASNFIEI